MWSYSTTFTMANEKNGGPQAGAAAAPPSTKTSPGAPTTSVTTPARPSIFSQRSMKQLGLFWAGAGFLALSTVITRRSVARKIRATIPSFFRPSNQPVTKVDSDSSLIALEALNLATLNVVGFGIMLTGGVSWAFDISSVDDLRAYARRHIGPGGGKTDEEAEREVEEWVAKVLGKNLKEYKNEPPTKAEG
jgi:hypothetical protein